MQIPDFDFDTASHTGSRIRGYSKETLTRLAADLEAAQQEIARLRAALEGEYRRGYERRDDEIKGALL